MTTIINGPDELIFSADYTEIKFLTSDVIEQIGYKAVNTLKISTNTAPGRVYHFYYGTPFIMTSASTPDSSGTQFKAGAGDFVPAAELIPYFRANSRLNRDFDISATEDGENVVFTAKKAAYGFTCTSTADMTNNIAGQPEIRKENFSLNFKLYLENRENSAFDVVYQANLQLLPNSSFTKIDIGEKIHSILTDCIRENLPERPTDEPIQCKNCCRRFYFEYGECYGNPVVSKTFARSETFTVLHGGLSTVASSKFNALQLIAPGAISLDRFLKQGAREFYTRVNQPQYLYFYNSRSSKTIDLVAEFAFFDSEETQRIVFPGITIEQFRKYAFNTRFDALYTEPVEGQLVQKYSVYFSLEGSKVSETITYVMDYTLNYYIRYFLNWSSMGALDSRVTTGKGETGINLENKTTARNSNPKENIQFGQSITYDSTISRWFTIYTGWLTRKGVLGNADFFLSDLKYRYYDETLILPIHIPATKIGETKDGDNLYSQVFAYLNHFVDRAYTDGDGEEDGMSLGIFGYNLGVLGSGSEIDPTVPSWVKAITAADIARWNANSNTRGEVVSAPASAQTSEGFFTLVWDAAKKAKYGDYGRFIIEMANGYTPAPIVISKTAGLPIAYTFELSRIDTLIHII